MGRDLRPLPTPPPLLERSNSLEGRCLLAYGRLGAGKTSYVMKRALAHARAKRLPIMANAAVYPGVRRLRSWEDVANLELCQDAGRRKCVNGCHVIDPAELLPGERTGCHPAVFIFDELHLWYPSMDKYMPREQLQDAFEMFSYLRKRGQSAYCTSQFPTRVNTGFRQLMTELIQVYPIMKGSLHAGRLIDPDTLEVLLGFTGSFSPRKVRYNTRAEVRPLWRAARGAPAARVDPPPSLVDPFRGDGPHRWPAELVAEQGWPADA